MIEQTFPRKYPAFVDRVLLRVGVLLVVCWPSFARLFTARFRWRFSEIPGVLLACLLTYDRHMYDVLLRVFWRYHGDGFQSAVLVWNFELVTSGHGVTVWRAYKLHIEQFSVGHIQSVQSFAVSVGLSPSGLHQAETAQIQYDTVPPIWYSYLDLESWSFPKTLYGGD